MSSAAYRLALSEIGTLSIPIYYKRIQVQTSKHRLFHKVETKNIRLRLQTISSQTPQQQDPEVCMQFRKFTIQLKSKSGMNPKKETLRTEEQSCIPEIKRAAIESENLKANAVPKVKQIIRFNRAQLQQSHSNHSSKSKDCRAKSREFYNRWPELELTNVSDCFKECTRIIEMARQVLKAKNLEEVREKYYEIFRVHVVLKHKGLESRTKPGSFLIMDGLFVVCLLKLEAKDIDEYSRLIVLYKKKFANHDEIYQAEHTNALSHLGYHNLEKRECKIQAPQVYSQVIVMPKPLDFEMSKTPTFQPEVQVPKQVPKAPVPVPAPVQVPLPPQEIKRPRPQEYRLQQKEKHKHERKPHRKHKSNQHKWSIDEDLELMETYIKSPRLLDSLVTKSRHLMYRTKCAMNVRLCNLKKQAKYEFGREGSAQMKVRDLLVKYCNFLRQKQRDSSSYSDEQKT